MSIKLTIKQGQRLGKTKVTLGHPGYAMLLADSREILERDYAMFRTIEQSFFAEAIARTITGTADVPSSEPRTFFCMRR